MKKTGSIILWVILGCFAASIAWVALTKFIPVAYTPFMLKRSIEYKMDGKDYEFRKDWVSINKISKNMPQAVVASEDNLFLQHHGFDWKSIEMARKHNAKGKKIHGGSTISQQTAKNVFTFGSRTYIRKSIEAYFTILIELIWGKERIMEVYLNVVELGNNIYGVEAASKHYFNHSAAGLSKREAATFAAVLPSPRKYRVVDSGPYVTRRTSQIMHLMECIGPLKFE